MKKIILISISLLLVIINAGCETNSSYCPEYEAVEAHNRIGEIYQGFADYLDLCTVFGGRVSDDCIVNLLEIKQVMVNVETPECLDKTKYNLVDAMTLTIGALTLANNGDLTGATNDLVEASQLVSEADQEILKLRRCLPNCTKEDMK